MNGDERSELHHFREEVRNLFIEVGHRFDRQDRDLRDIGSRVRTIEDAQLVAKTTDDQRDTDAHRNDETLADQTNRLASARRWRIGVIVGVVVAASVGILNVVLDLLTGHVHP